MTSRKKKSAKSATDRFIEARKKTCNRSSDYYNARVGTAYESDDKEDHQEHPERIGKVVRSSVACDNSGAAIFISFCANLSSVDHTLASK